MATPPPLDSDAEDVAWALQTAESLWKRGELADALHWVRRAVQAANDAELDDRALELARAAAELADLVPKTGNTKPPSAPPVDAWAAAAAGLDALPPPPPVEDIPAPRPSAEDLLIDVEVEAAPSAPVPDDDEGVVTSAPPVAKPAPGKPPGPPPRKGPPGPPPRKPPPRPPTAPPPRVTAVSIDAEPISVDPEALAANAPAAAPPAIEPAPPPAAEIEETITEWPPSEHAPLLAMDPSMPPPAPEAPPAPVAEPAAVEPLVAVQPPAPVDAVSPSVAPAEGRGVRGGRALGLPSRSRTVPGGFSPEALAEQQAQADADAAADAAAVAAALPEVPDLAPPEPAPAPPPVAAAPEPAVVHEAPPEAAPTEVTAPPHHEAPTRPGKAPSSTGMRAAKPIALDIDGDDLLGTPEPPKPRPAAPPRPAPPARPKAASIAGAPPRPAPAAAAAPAPAPAPEPPPAPAAAVPDGPLDLSETEAFADLPDDVRDAFAAAARLATLDVEEEEAGFALAYVVHGEVDVLAAVVDTPAARLKAGAVLRARGTVDSSIALRVVGTAGKARVAVWDDEAVATALGACPWVEDDLRAASDRFQALAGATMGQLADKLDVSLRDALLGSLETRVLAEGEVLAEAGESVPGVVVVGVGELELVNGEKISSRVTSGEFLFPLEVLGGAKARSTARAGKGGAVVLMGGRARTQELVATYPSLLEILAGM
jgi:hypothetical protein